MGQEKEGSEDPSHGGGEVRGGRRPARGQWLRAAGMRPAPDLSRPEAHDPVVDTLDTGGHITVSVLDSVMATDPAKQTRQTRGLCHHKRLKSIGCGWCVYAFDSSESPSTNEFSLDTALCPRCVWCVRGSFLQVGAFTGHRLQAQQSLPLRFRDF